MSQPIELAPRQAAAAAAPTVAEIYSEYAKFVWRNLRRLGVATELVEDAVQDVFLVVHRRLPEFKGRSSLRTWLFGIVLRVAAHHREKQRSGSKRFAATSPDVLDEVAAIGSQGPFEKLAQRQAADLVYLALDSLDQEKRTMFVMVELEQMSVVEAAEVLGLNLNTAYSRYKRGTAAFAKQLKRVTKRQGSGA